MTTADVVAVIGGGHNGLVCAARLADAGYDVSLLERRGRLGGAVDTARFPCGCYINRGANAYGMLDPSVHEFLARLSFDPSALPAVPDLVLQGDDGRTLTPAALLKDPGGTDDLSAEEIAAYSRYLTDLAAAVESTRDLWSKDTATLLELRRRLGRLDSPFARRVIDGSIQEICSEYGLGERLSAAVAACAVLFPSRPGDSGTALPLLYLGLSDVGGAAWGVIAGGYDVLIDALESACRMAGVSIRLGSTATSITRVKGRMRVDVANGDVIDADFVMSAIDPWSTAALCAAGHGEIAFRPRDVLDHDGGCAKLNMLVQSSARDRLPPMTVRLPNLAFLDDAYDSYREGALSKSPYLEVSNTAAVDPSASCGAHMPVSVFVLFARYLEDSLGNHRQRAAITERVFWWLSEHLGVERRSVDWIETLTPLDIQREWGMTRGNVDHGAMRLPNIFEKRPAQSDGGRAGTYLDGKLILCGSARHPGGLVSGRPGWLAAGRLMGV